MNLKPAQVASVTIGVWPDKPGMTQVPGFVTALPFAGSQHHDSMIVVRFTVPKHPESDLKLQRQGDHRSQPIYTAQGFHGWMPNPTTLVIAELEDLHRCINRNGREIRHAQFDFAGGSADILIAGIVDPSVASTAMPAEAAAELARSGPQDLVFTETMKRVAQAGALSVTVDTLASITVRISCRDSASADELKSAIDKQAAESLTTKTPLHDNPQFREMLEKRQALMEQMAVNKFGSTVTLSVSLDDSILDLLPSP